MRFNKQFIESKSVLEDKKKMNRREKQQMNPVEALQL